MMNYVQGVYDYLSVTIHSERMPLTPVISISYPQKYNHQLVHGGLGNPMIAFRPAGVARGRFEGDFSMKMLKPAWDIFESLYLIDEFGVHTSDPSVFVVTFKRNRGLSNVVHQLSVVISEVEEENLDNDGGKAVEVSVKGFQTEPYKKFVNGVFISGLPPTP